MQNIPRDLSTHTHTHILTLLELVSELRKNTGY